jgi:PKD repeat protein
MKNVHPMRRRGLAAAISVLSGVFLLASPAAAAHRPTAPESVVSATPTNGAAASPAVDSLRPRITAESVALSAAAPQFGIKDQSTAGASTAPSGSKPESKLWYNDGIWWAELWSSTASQFHIFRLASSGLSWQDTGTVIDPRASTRGDALWDGAHLYIASHDVASDSSHNTANRPARLYRFSYNGSTQTYSLDAGFPVLIANVAVETLVIDKDSTGTLWATWTQAKKLMISHTVGNDLTWATPFTPAITGTGLTSDDISSVIAFGGNRIGVMWSNQSTSHMYFTTHRDGDPDTAWTASEAATTGSGSADDHINLKTDSSGRIYAATKTSFTASSAVLIHLLVRAAGGGWSDIKFGTVAESHTRPIVLIDEQAGMLHMYATGPYPGSSSGQSGGSIYEKTSPLGSLSFTSGSGTPVIQDPSSADMNNATSTKQNVNASTGIVIVATNDTKDFYWHSTETLGSGTPPTANFTGTPTSGAAPLKVAFTDTSTGGPTSWSWDFGDPGSGSANTSTSENPSHTYNGDGSYTVKLTAINASGSTTKTLTGYITVASPPAANFTAAPTAGSAPLTVSFTDTSTGNPTSWSWDFGDPGSGSANTSTSQNPSHDYESDGTYTVALTATNANGSTTKTVTDLVVVGTAPVAAFSGSPTSGAGPLAVDFTDASTGRPTSWSWDFGDPGS